MTESVGRVVACRRNAHQHLVIDDRHRARPIDLVVNALLETCKTLAMQLEHENMSKHDSHGKRKQGYGWWMRLGSEDDDGKPMNESRSPLFRWATLQRMGEALGIGLGAFPRTVLSVIAGEAACAHG
jgi:hypothetical protein